jgi:hypothetical protein
MQSIRLFIWTLGLRILDKVKGFVLGESLSGVLAREQLGRVLERDGMYSMILRVILIKQPSGSQLLDWMVGMRDKKLSLAAESVISDSECSDLELLPIRALILSILYPTLSVQDLVTDLRTEGANPDTIARAARLVGAYLGEEEILRRRR